MAHDVFLSYAAADKATALEVLKGLEDHAIRCWIAPRDIPAGSEYGEQIIEAVKGSRIFVVIFSASANTSPHDDARSSAQSRPRKPSFLSASKMSSPPAPWNTHWATPIGSMHSPVR